MNKINIDKKIKSWKIIKKDILSDDRITIKRPADLKCHIYKVKVKGEAWTILIGLVDDKPYEVFGGLSKYIDVPNKFKDGKLIKNGKVDGITTYNLILGEGDDQMIIKDVVNVFENATYGAFTRMISLSLRHKVPVHFLVEQLQKDKYSDITSFSKVMARTLKHYIEEGTKSGTNCAECKSVNMVFEQGCVRCLDCGWTKC